MVRADQLTPDLLKHISQLSVGGHSRTRLAEHLCQTLGWRGPSGQLQLMDARKRLRQLEKQQQLQLQPVVRVVPKAKPIQPYERPALRVTKLRELGRIERVAIPPGRSSEGRL